MGTKNTPGSYDCYGNAEPDEPMFILLARDPAAPLLVREWARMRQAMIDSGEKPLTDQPKVAEAFRVANEMIEWHKANRP